MATAFIITNQMSNNELAEMAKGFKADNKQLREQIFGSKFETIETNETEEELAKSVGNLMRENNMLRRLLREKKVKNEGKS